MLRITQESTREGGALLRLEGRLAGPWVAELGAACDALLANGRALTLELSGLSYVEREGARLLETLAGRVAVTGSNDFVAGQLAGGGPRTTNGGGLP